MAFLPSIAYALIIYMNDVKGIDKRRAISYFIGGILSVSIFKLYTMVFPNSHTLQFFEIVGFDLKATLYTWLMFAFVQVGLLEESVKMAAGKIISFIGGHSKHDENSSIFSTMFYFGVVALGFAFIENSEYFIAYAKNGSVDIGKLFFLRTVMAMVMHLLMGLMMGYFIAISRFKSGFSSLKYHIMGLLIATLMHGSYDFIVFAFSDLQESKLLALLAIPMLISLTMVTIAGKSLLKNSQRHQAILKMKRKLLHKA